MGAFLSRFDPRRRYTSFCDESQPSDGIPNGDAGRKIRGIEIFVINGKQRFSEGRVSVALKHKLNWPTLLVRKRKKSPFRIRLIGCDWVFNHNLITLCLEMHSDLFPLDELGSAGGGNRWLTE